MPVRRQRAPLEPDPPLLPPELPERPEPDEPDDPEEPDDPDEPLMPPEFDDELPDEPLMPPELDELPEDALRPEELLPCELLSSELLPRSGEEAELPVELAYPSPCDELPRFWSELLDEPRSPSWLPDDPEVFLSAMILSSEIRVDVHRSRARRPPARFSGRAR